MFHHPRQQVGKIPNTYQTTPIRDSAERQRPTFVNPTHQPQEIGSHSGAVNQGQSDYRVLHARGTRDVTHLAACDFTAAGIARITSAGEVIREQTGEVVLQGSAQDLRDNEMVQQAYLGEVKTQ